MSIVKLTPEYFPHPDIGRPIDNAQIYVGEPDKNPLTDPIDLYALQEDGTEVLLAQPARTSAGGIPLYNGSPVTLTVRYSSYSLTIQDELGAQVYHVPSIEDGADELTMTVEGFVGGVDFTAGVDNSITLAEPDPIKKGLLISFDGARQHQEQFTLSGNVITFTDVIPASTLNIEVVIFAYTTINIGVPSADSITTAMLQDGAVTPVKTSGVVVNVNTVLYDTAGSFTYTKPSNLISAYVYASGGGAKGGDAPGVAAQFCAAGGGGAGGLARKLFQDADLAATTAITIGAGGTSITLDGGQTDFGAHLTGNGGYYGNDGTSGTTASIERGGLAGLSSGGEFAGASEMGGNGKPGVALGGGDSLGGQGGASKFSEGGAVPNAGVAGGNGWPGYFGSGGGGAAAGSGGTSRTGGDGGDGVVYIIEYLGA